MRFVVLTAKISTLAFWVVILVFWYQRCEGTFIFSHKYRGNTFLRNIGIFLQVLKASQSRRQTSRLRLHITTFKQTLYDTESRYKCRLWHWSSIAKNMTKEMLKYSDILNEIQRVCNEQLKMIPTLDETGNLLISLQNHFDMIIVKHSSAELQKTAFLGTTYVSKIRT
jgi:hypothetical protein